MPGSIGRSLPFVGPDPPIGPQRLALLPVQLGQFGTALLARKGDQLVGVQVTLPEKLSPEQEELMKKLAESAGMAY